MRKLLLFLCLIPFVLSAQTEIERIEPPFWWTGMNNTSLQIMLYGKNLAYDKPEINYEGVSIEKVITVENNNYMFLYLNISDAAKAGMVNIQLKNRQGEVTASMNYELKERQQDAASMQGYDNSDVMCLITPDRFANGDPSNDNVEGMLEGPSRSDKWGRHGGDLRGMINNLDYFAEMGYTAIWLNPLLENDQEQWSYHGYSTTDYYKVDPRFGTNEEYAELAEKGRQKGIKIIMDMIVNHCGSGHWWMKDLPSKDWINNADDPFYTTHVRTTLRDPHVSKYDLEHFSDGWFVETMPDLNQRNPLMADYLIQNTIWWIEYLGLAGIRMDTYPYSDKDFMSKWTCAVMDEYPNFNICGEEWSYNPIILAYWQNGKNNPDGYSSCLPGLLDFPLQNALVKSLTEKAEWGSDMRQLYEMVSNDFIYADPAKHVIFPDNHDMSRIFTQLDEDLSLFKLAISFFATMRGTPQFYYGTEILMSNKGDDSHGNIRSDFPGGWKGDKINGFTQRGLTQDQKEAQNFVKKILQWRKTATAIHHGKLMHFVPQHHVYTYFRYDENQKVMVLLNKEEKEVEINLEQFAEMFNKGTRAKDIITDQQIVLNDKLVLASRQAMILELY